MARIHENALKWINEQLKKKPVKNRSNNVVVEEDLRQCIYCHKIFLNATFVVKHMFKRHAEQFLRQHKKSIDKTKTDTDVDSQSALVNYLQSEFSNLKTELEILKKAVVHHTYHIDQNKSQVTDPTGLQECKGSREVLNINMPEDNLLSNNTEVEKVTRDDFVKLQEKIEEVSRLYKDVVTSSKGKEDRICKRLKNELLTDFENLLVRYQDQNCEWKEPILQLRKDLRRLERTVELNPEVLGEIENKIEQQIESFCVNYEVVGGRNKTPSKTSGKGSSSNVHRSNRRQRSIYSYSSKNLNLQKRQLDTTVNANAPHLHTGVSEAHTSSILKGDLKNMHKLGAQRAKILFDEKLKYFSISPSVKHMSADEYETKMHLVSAQKESLCQKYANFQQVYERLDSHANELVKSQMERKLQKRLRFSDSISSQTSEMNDKVNNSEHISEKLGEKMNSGLAQQSDLMNDLDAYGDISDIQNECVETLNQGDCGLGAANEKEDDLKFPEHFVTSHPNLLPTNAFSELKITDNPPKCLSNKPLNDYFKYVDESGELSSLESYSDS